MKEDIKQQIDVVMRTGKVIVGSKSVVLSLLSSEPKMVLMANNTREDIRKRVSYYAKLANVPVLTVQEDSMELGAICKKPYPISAISIMNPGTSSIMESTKQKNSGQNTS